MLEEKSSIKIMKRSAIREAAFKLIYSFEIQEPENLEEQIDLYLECEEITDKEAKEYIIDAINGIKQHTDEINNLIKKNLKADWTLESAPALRDESYRRGMDAMLKRVEFQCGLAYGTLSDPQNVDKTAEEIRSSKQRSYTTVKDLQRALGNALTDLVYSISKLLDAQWNSGAAVSPPGDCNVTFDFDDSIISDPKERKQMYWGYVTAGKFPFWRYLVEFEGYSEDDAKAIAAEANAENRSPEALTFGGA